MHHSLAVTSYLLGPLISISSDYIKLVMKAQGSQKLLLFSIWGVVSVQGGQCMHKWVGGITHSPSEADCEKLIR